jgi:hypothetical protein
MEEHTMRIGLLPLDERPVNTRYPAMIAGIAGVDLVLPPPALLPSIRQAADCETLVGWLHEHASALDVLIVSCELLGFGGLIASRISDDDVHTIISRLNSLSAIKRQHPHLVIYGFNVITRVSNSNNAFEEPVYWADHGVDVYRLSQLLDQHTQGQPVMDELTALQVAIPAAHVRDFIQRRLRNHTVNLAALRLLADSVFDLLVLSSDDTSPYGLPSSEKHWLSTWSERLAIGERLLMYPGADEVGCVLLARVINQRHNYKPTFRPEYAVPGSEHIVAAYEDGPIRVTVERQIRAAGGMITAEGGDFWLLVNPPIARRSEWHPEYAEEEYRTRRPFLQPLITETMNQPSVILADVAYPNGADPLLIDLLKQHDVAKLAAYGAWNTAGNTIGTALAQACATRLIDSDTQRSAQEQFLLHRFVEDWGYQQLVRAQAREWLEQTSGQREPTVENLAATCRWIEARLQPLIAELPGFANRYRITPGSLRLPWNRTFEVDFDLELTTAVSP